MTKNKIITRAIGVALGLASLSTFALAKDNDKKDPPAMSHSGSAMELSIKGNGTISFKGLKVTAINGNTITGEVAVGSTSKITLTVVTSSSTKYSGQKDGQVSLSDIKVGDYLSVDGTLTVSGNTFTVLAKKVNDGSLVKVKKNPKTIFEGTLKTIGASTTPTVLGVTIGGKDLTVNVPSGISIVNVRYLPISISALKIGDKIRIYGAVQASSTMTIDASIIRDISFK